MQAPRIVVKVGTNVMTNRDRRIVRPVLRNLVRQIAEVYERGLSTVLVSSGSIIAGMELLGPNISADNETQRRQVYSATGQPRLMGIYYELFAEYGLRSAQVLPTKSDFSVGAKRDNMVQCLEGLLGAGILPVVNEDDAVSVTQSMFHDNDELASLMAELLGADRFIILTDADGVFDGHPSHEHTSLIPSVSANDDLSHFITESGKGEAEGRGGMGSKLAFAQQAARLGIPTHIVNGTAHNSLVDVIDGKRVGTLVSPLSGTPVS